MSTYTFTHIYVHIHTFTHTLMQVRTHACTHTCTEISSPGGLFCICLRIPRFSCATLYTCAETNVLLKEIYTQSVMAFAGLKDLSFLIWEVGTVVSLFFSAQDTLLSSSLIIETPGLSLGSPRTCPAYSMNSIGAFGLRPRGGHTTFHWLLRITH